MKKLIIKENKEDLVKRIMSCDVCVSDFDFTDADSPAYNIIKSKILKNPLNKKLFLWVLKYLLSSKDDYKKELYWKDFEDTFLRKEKNSEEAVAIIEEKKEEMFYPGIKDFYLKYFSGKPKIYITRSPKYLVEPFAKELGIRKVFDQAHNKAGILECFIANNPQYKKYFVKGDSEIDNQMLDVLELYKKLGVIDDYVSCHISKKLTYKNSKYHINMKPNYGPLNKLLENIN